MWGTLGSGKHSSNHIYRETNVIAMRLGPGKHLKGRKLLGGVEPEEFDYFYEVCLCGLRPAMFC